MKTYIHRAEKRGHGNHGWLDSKFSFSFADYFDTSRMGFGALRVVNDDTIAPSSGFPMHPHDNMEIITIVTEGAVQHKDSMGNGSVIRPGEAQRMSAGSGIMHSEWNPSKDETLKLFQIWIKTRDKNIEPEYEQSKFDLEAERGSLVTIVSGEKEDGGLTFHQDAVIARGVFDKGQSYEYRLKHKNSGVFIIIVEGGAEVDGEQLNKRDSIEIKDALSVKIKALDSSDIILMEVPI